MNITAGSDMLVLRLHFGLNGLKNYVDKMCQPHNIKIHGFCTIYIGSIVYNDYSGRAFERCIGDYLLFVYFSRTKPMKMTVTHKKGVFESP